jgi:hypothetical protein
LTRQVPGNTDEQPSWCHCPCPCVGSRATLAYDYSALTVHLQCTYSALTVQSVNSMTRPPVQFLVPGPSHTRLNSICPWPMSGSRPEREVDLHLLPAPFCCPTTGTGPRTS